MHLHTHTYRDTDTYKQKQRASKPAFCTSASEVYEKALGGLHLMGGMRGISLQEVINTVHMALDLAGLQRQVVDVLITDLAKYFNNVT